MEAARCGLYQEPSCSRMGSLSGIGETISLAAEIARKPELVVAPVAALLASVGMLVLGNGLFGTLIVLRAGLEGYGSQTIGMMMSSYSAGYGLGALLLPALVVRVGHIRAFAGFAAITSTVALLHLLFVHAWAWMALRALFGFLYAGMILLTESWLNAHALDTTRGRLLGLYGVLTMGASALGQGFLNFAPPAGITLFLVVSILISLALVPITLLPNQPPAIPPKMSFHLRSFLSTSPLSAIGAFLSGLSLSPYWGLGPNFAQKVGFDAAGTSAFMAVFLIGAVTFQWPLGWLSDRFSRRLIIASASLGSALAGLGFVLIPGAAPPILLSLGFAFGGFGIPLYTLLAAHASDQLNAGETLVTSRGMLFLNGLGAVLGPVSAGALMNRFGPESLFIHTSVVLIVLALVALLCRVRG